MRRSRRRLDARSSLPASRYLEGSRNQEYSAVWKNLWDQDVRACIDGLFSDTSYRGADFTRSWSWREGACRNNSSISARIVAGISGF